MEKRKETFTVTEKLSLETSYGSVRKPVDVELKITVGIKDSTYGYYELYDTLTGGEDWYAEGGLWFQGKILVDYDGMFSLSGAVIDKLKEWGYSYEWE